MAKEKKTEGTTEKDVKPKEVKTPVRRVWNASKQKLELDIEGVAVAILPKQTVEIPVDFVIPPNIGLIER